VARTGTVHKLRIDLSDVDRNVYELLELRVAQHPSEPVRRVLLKTLAYALSTTDGIAFSKGGLSDTDEPEISVSDPMGVALWIEIGAPAADRLKRATNAARKVDVFCAGDVPGVLERARSLSRAERVTVHAIDPAFLDALADAVAAASGRFALVRSGGQLYATCNGATLESTITATEAGAG
jgi:uncharacterized protein YaeQ